MYENGRIQEHFVGEKKDDNVAAITINARAYIKKNRETTERKNLPSF